MARIRLPNDPESWIVGIICAVVAAFVIAWWEVRRERRQRERQIREAKQRMGDAPPPASGPTYTPQMPSADRAGFSVGIDLFEAPAAPARPVPPRVPAPAAPLPPVSTPDLSLGTFAPISDDDLKKQSNLLDPRQNVAFGRRGLIPPVSDPRTLLIDKALVAHGLLSPEELAEIHRVGQQMDELRPDAYVVQQQVSLQIDQLEIERKKIKEEKKRQAAQRKLERAQAIAHRKATDIIFLGRGVSKGLADRRCDLEKLQTAGLPALATPADVARAMSITIPTLRWLGFHSEATTTTHYVRFTVPKRSGGTRMLFAPHEKLATAQEWILENILKKVPAHPPAHGFVTGRSTLTNATPHLGRDVVVNADLSDFFPTITFPRVKGIFRLMGYSPAVATVLALLCTESPRRVVEYAGKTFHVATGPRALPQGACTSPALSNLSARRLDSRLSGLARKLDWTYTRYADDITFSASGEPAEHVGRLLAHLRHIAGEEGFAVNQKKTRVLKQSARQSVTGVVVNRRPGVPRDLYKRIRAILHRAKHQGLASQNRENRPHFEAWIRGMIAYVQMLNPVQGLKLKLALEQSLA